MRIFCLTILYFLGLGCASAKRSKVSTITGADASVAELDLNAYIEQQGVEHHLTGLETVIVKQGRVVFQRGYGWAIDQQARVTNDTVFRLASISKTVVAVLFMRLLQDHADLHLDDDISAVAGFTIRNPRFSDTPITFRQLLTHSSSINDNYAGLSDELFPDNTDTPISLREFVEAYFNVGGAYYYPANNFTENVPGSAHKYSNLAVTLLGFLVERISGMSLEQFSEEALFRPLGMFDTVWKGEGFSPAGGLATPYDWDASGLHPLGVYGYPDWPAGSLRASGSQLAKLMLLFMNRGIVGGTRILETATVEEMLRIQAPSIAPDQGLILYYLDNPTLPTARLGHNGGDPGVRTEMYFQRDPQGLGVIVLCNCNATGDVSRQAAFSAVRNRLFTYGASL